MAFEMVVFIGLLIKQAVNEIVNERDTCDENPVTLEEQKVAQLPTVRWCRRR